jgi:hypothetical protein
MCMITQYSISHEENSYVFEVAQFWDGVEVAQIRATAIFGMHAKIRDLEGNAKITDPHTIDGLNS